MEATGEELFVDGCSLLVGITLNPNLTLNHNLGSFERIASRGSDTLVALVVRLGLKSDRIVASTAGTAWVEKRQECRFHGWWWESKIKIRIKSKIRSMILTA